MIKIEELRIGSWVKNNSYWCYRGENTIDFQWDTNDWCALKEGVLLIENIEPIKITEKTLLKFDFAAVEYASGWFYKDDIIIDVAGFMCCYKKAWFDINIQYLHQLQNLYFAIIGTDLVMKAKSSKVL